MTIDFIEYDKIIYELAFVFLETLGVKRDTIKAHFEHRANPSTLADLYGRMAESAQNKQMSSNVIGKAIGGIENLRKILFNFNVQKIVKYYPVGTEDLLFKEIDDKLYTTGDFRNKKRSLWPQYCKSLTTSAQFFSQFSSSADFNLWANDLAKDEKTQSMLPLIISMEIYGIGFPLACDFLKEIGFRDYGKPDVHLIYIFEHLNLIGSPYTNKNKVYLILKAMQRIAKNNITDAYNIDKIFWLIGSGKIQNIDGKIGRNRETFVEFVKNSLDIT